jgi:PadR family transcriptional regulator
VTRTRRPSPQTAAVLQALAADPGRWHYGYELCTQLDIRAGSLYPILIRLADRGLLESMWETERVSGRPARHMYRLTATGHAYVVAIVAALPGAVPAVRRPRPQWEGA